MTGKKKEQILGWLLEIRAPFDSGILFQTNEKGDFTRYAIAAQRKVLHRIDNVWGAIQKER